MTNQQIAFQLAWEHAQAGKRVKLSKENGKWFVTVNH